ncbi:MAG: 50S ribosomal protein L3 [Nanoarchaeota archaeon]|nr:50S ribosomal protein L3 [Nanoarchaeota archaeon]
MPTRKSPRKGSLQFWPRKRANKFLPRVNWSATKNNSSKVLKGFIGYKVGMATAYVKDDTGDSMTKGKRITLPITILECPTMKIFSVRFYKEGSVAKEILAENLDKELKIKVKLPKKKMDSLDKVSREEFDDIRVILYSQVKKTNIKKTPDLSEIGLSGNVEEKLSFVKENLSKDISVSDVFERNSLVDLRGLTKGHGFSGAVKRFGVQLRQHKTEKGRRGPGSIGPWHPARVTFRVPMPGQLGMFTRISYNSKIIEIEKAEGEKKITGFKNFGDVKSDYLILNGSVQGPEKRQILITVPIRETKKQLKKNYELIELR